MGFQRSTLMLKFEDPDLTGLEVHVKRLPMGDMFAVAELADMGNSITENMKALDELLEHMASNMISWNLEDEHEQPVPLEKGHPARKDEDGTRVPSTGMYSVDIDLVMAIVKAWLDALGGVDRPLQGSSNSGEPSQEEFGLMEALSESQ